MVSYNKIILLAFMILPLFTGSLAVGGLQTAYGGNDQGECENDSECDDGVSCTVDKCVLSSCQNTPDDASCDDGVSCTDDICDDVLGCQFFANDGNCDDGVSCTDDICDDVLDCQFPPDDGVCDDGVSCTDDICDPVSDCSNNPKPAGTPCSCSVGEGVCDENNECIVEISIDIKPGSDPNSINVKKMGLVPLAILGSDTFDVSIVDYANVGFGPSGALPIHMSLEDVNDDGFIDLVLLYVQQETGIVKGDTEACVTGELDGQPFSGCDAIKTPGN